MFRFLLLCALAALPLRALAERPPATVPRDPAQILERLPRGYAEIEPTRAAEAKPGLQQAVTLLNIAARTGDTRLARRADVILSRLPADRPPIELLRARAFSAQHRHDFSTALTLLDQLIVTAPRDGDARFSRMQIQLVQGNLERARGDCTSLALGIDSDLGLLCVAALGLRAGQYESAASLLDRWLAGASDAQTRRYVLVMRAEVAARQHAYAEADRWFHEALALDRYDVRTLNAYCRFLLARGRAGEVLPLLASAGDSDGLQLQRALAAAAVGDPTAAALAQAQGERYRLARRLGSPAEMRDEAEFLLTLQHDAQGALQLAQRNFNSQRDYEDVRLLQRASAAAHAPASLQLLKAWAQTQHLQIEPLPMAGR